MTATAQSDATLATDDAWFRPYFLVDDKLRVSGWPDVTARTLERPAERTLGRHCWETMESWGCTGSCHNQNAGLFGTGMCSRLPVGNGQRGWIVWLNPDRIVRSDPGSATLEGLLVRGALTHWVATQPLNSILDAIRHACGAADCELFLLEGQREEVVLRGCVGADREAFLQRTRMPLGQGYPGKIIQTCQPLCTSSLQEDDRFLRDAVKHSGIQTIIGVPLLDGAHPMGYLGVAWKQGSIPLGWALHLVEGIQSLLIEAARHAARPHAPSLPQCVLRCFGPLELEHDNRRMAQDAFPRRKALDLLRHLVLARGAPLQRDVLVERLWPDAHWYAGVNRLHVTINALRSTLATILPQHRGTLITQRHGNYRLDIDALGPIDAFVFSDAIDAARTRLRENNPDAAIRFLEQALPLYRGELFADAEDIAFEPHRQYFRLRYREGLRMLVDLYLHEGRTETALEALFEARERADVESDLQDLIARCGDDSMAPRMPGAR
ncbi:MAG: GAF domain-containing protein [Gammaproteobacteria bacterium]|nr:GAF domain-containing protein [Gammaproteobacteria bacterium]MBP6052318.1 GAF domain-containing protein [Pseudomonadales bacterium]MBK6584768.1 GAF domain-containing protein [Gammaproteobacteria bacterium]MBK7169944.1 GAF domain-containing protein [Gammaproteobacteria bacterium]MBK7519721.1 GAF domain-containing protein [Gammaproteobacteria bacterium]